MTERDRFSSIDVSGAEAGSEAAEPCPASALTSDAGCAVPIATDSRVISLGECCRKFLHMLPAALPFLLAFKPHQDPLTWGALRYVGTIAAILTVVFLLLFRVVRRSGEKNLLITVLSYPLTVLTPMFLFRGNAEFTCVVVVVLGLGDGSAFIGGKLFGNRRLPWNPKKSWVGTLCFFLVAAPFASLAYWLEARNPAAPWSLALACGGAAALAGAVAESLPTEITDNLRVGVAAAVAVVVTHFALAGWLLS